MSDQHLRLLLGVATAALERGEAFGIQFLIPDGDRSWRIVCRDLEAVGQNDLGIPPKVFAHGAVGTLVGALDARECYVAEASFLATPAITPPPSQHVGRGIGDEPNPSPAVVVTVFGKGRLDVRMHPYTTAAGGRIAWGEPTITSTRQPGPLGSALPLWRAVNRERSPMPPADQLVEDMVDAGFLVIVEGGNGDA